MEIVRITCKTTEHNVNWNVRILLAPVKTEIKQRNEGSRQVEGKYFIQVYVSVFLLSFLSKF